MNRKELEEKIKEEISAFDFYEGTNNDLATSILTLLESSPKAEADANSLMDSKKEKQ